MTDADNRLTRRILLTRAMCAKDLAQNDYEAVRKDCRDALQAAGHEVEPDAPEGAALRATPEPHSGPAPVDEMALLEEAKAKGRKKAAEIAEREAKAKARAGAREFAASKEGAAAIREAFGPKPDHGLVVDHVVDHTPVEMTPELQTALITLRDVIVRCEAEHKLTKYRRQIFRDGLANERHHARFAVENILVPSHDDDDETEEVA
jgi:hypothetical protein